MPATQRFHLCAWSGVAARHINLGVNTSGTLRTVSSETAVAGWPFCLEQKCLLKSLRYDSQQSPEVKISEKRKY
ncbi:hypothetical protein RRG08_041410 [Elysia crispata]|uniref:Uncharacterized protein n=1 Tax=Elysia crispata TaxID=231223 RepID=A0AAE1CL23_9GAST|nr:hypothetical protein RRG08_041410 [Elysia crispata]